jgi:energy-coupling factor transporter ATP-binding protein EcfA2
VAAALADQLLAARRRAFVGRRAELALLSKLVASPGEGAVVYVHGAGGIGKSTLLRQLGWLAESAGRRVVWLDGRDLGSAGTHLPTSLRQLMDSDPAGTAPVLVVDTAEALGPPDRWLREDLLTALPADALVAVAGREPPPLMWRVDPGWRDLVRTVTLTNLAAGEAADLLTALGVPAADHGVALAFTHGHPLALALVADVYAQRGGRLRPAVDPEVVTVLLAGLLDAVPGPAHRSALEACAQVRVTTEPLLAALLDVADARELFDWLRGLSMMELGPRGLFPHDLAREALAAELRWRHPERYAEIHHRAGAYYQQQFAGADPAARHAIMSDFAYLHRDNEVLRPFLSVLSPAAPAVGDLVVTAGRPDDRAAVVALIERHEGTESAAIAAYWLDRQPDCLAVIRTGAGETSGERAGESTGKRYGEIAGCYLAVAVEAATAPDRAADPGVDRACGYLAGNDPPRAEETALLLRFWLSATDYQDFSPVCTAITLHLLGRCLTTPNLAVTLLSYADPDFWAATSAYADFSRAPAADFTVAGRSFGVYAHDWRAVPPLAWLSLLAARETADEPLAVTATATAPALRVLDADEFARAVRAALHDVGRPDRLAGSALLRARVITAHLDADAGPIERGQAVQKLVQDAAAQLAASPRDRRAYRALHHTYLQPAGSQQRAAELLDLPISTFRRHLAAGVERLTELLWKQELAG